MAPWKLGKSDSESAGKVLFTAAEALRVSSILLNPVMPNRTQIILKTFGAEGSSLDWGGLIGGKILSNMMFSFQGLMLINQIKKTGQSKK